MHWFQIVMRVIILICLLSLTSAEDLCGGLITADTGHIQSPNYPQQYYQNMNCAWYITVPEDYKVSFTFEFFELESDQGCKFDYVEILNGFETTSPVLHKFCGNRIPSCIHSSRNKMTVRFRTDSTQQYQGFTANFIKVTYGSNLTQDEGRIQSLNYPEPYGFNMDYTWYITVPEHYKVHFTFVSFELEFDELCANDYVEIRDGHESTSPVLSTLCGDLIPTYIHSSSNKMAVRFKTDSVESRATRGFKAFFIKDKCGGKLTEYMGQIQSPYYPQPYGFNMECTWFITVQENNKVNFTFEFFELEDNQICDHDYVEIRDGHEIKSPVLGKFCNTSVLSHIQSSSNEIAVTFRSDMLQSWPAKGFKAFFIKDTCGENLTLDEGRLQSPNYPIPYGINIDCTWYITVAEQYKVKFIFEDFQLEFDEGCNNDYLEIRDGHESTSPVLRKFCGDVLPSYILSSSNKMAVIFRSDYVVSNRAKRGFEAIFTKDACGGNLTLDVGRLQSPNYPIPYGLNIDCTWYITVAEQYNVKFISEDFQLGFDEGCNNDYVEIRDGHESTSPVLRKFCGNGMPSYIHSSSNKMAVRFKTGYIVSNRAKRGFEAIFTKVTCGGNLTQDEGRFLSPNYPNPYWSIMICTWFITVPENNKVNLTFESFELQGGQGCDLDYVEIRDGHEIASPVLGKFCDTNVPPRIHSSSNKIAVTFRPHVYQSDPKKKGFKAFFTKDTCGGHVMQNVGYIQSPNYPEPYGPNMDCIWYITVPKGYQVTLTFVHFELEGNSICDNDYVEILDGHESKNLSLGRFCYDRVPSDINSSSNKIAIKFRSDNTNQYMGFKAFFIKGRDECKQDNHGCEHDCINSRTGYHCACWPGFTLHSDGKACKGDIFGPFAIQKTEQVTVSTTSGIPTAGNTSNHCMPVELTTAERESTTDVTTKEPSSSMSKGPSSAVEELAMALKKAKIWIMNQRHEVWGWGKSTPRAIVALYFSDPNLFASESSDLKWMSKELELQLAFDLIRNETDPLSLGELSLYLNAFLTTCHNPANINGLNLIQELRLMTDHELQSNNFISPSVFVTLCLAGVTSFADIEKLEFTLQDTSKYLSVGAEALALMALTCIAKNPKFADSSRGYLHELLKSSLNKLVLSFHRNETSGNLYATALVAQALQVNIEKNQFDRMAAVQNLLSLQEPDGSFGNLLATYYVIPILTERSLLDLSLHCEHVVQSREVEMSPLSVLQEKGHKRIAVEYSLWHEKPSKFKYTVQLRVQAGTNFLSIMHLAQSENELFRFKFEQLSTGLSVYSIGGVPNDEEQGLQWILYVEDKVSAPVQSNGSSVLVPFGGNISSLIPQGGDQVVFWYRHQK